MKNLKIGNTAYNLLVEKFTLKKKNILMHKKFLEDNPKLYNDLTTRLIADCLYYVIGSKTICEWYDIYSVNDKHLQNAAKIALKDVGIL